MNPQELKAILSSGLLSFPVTDFDAQGDFNRAGYVKRLEWLGPYGASALFAAGGTGEFFSLEPREYSEIIKTAVDTCAGTVPISPASVVRPVWPSRWLRKPSAWAPRVCCCCRTTSPKPARKAWLRMSSRSASRSTSAWWCTTATSAA